MNTENTNTTETKPQAKVFFAVLCYGGLVYHDWMASVTQTLTKTQLIAHMSTIAGDSLVCRARNNLAAEFLKSNCTHLLFIDCDIAFEPWMIQRLLKHDKPLVCGMYPLKQVKPGWVLNLVPGEQVEPNGLCKVRESGTGFMLIKREVFVKMAEAFPEIEYTPDDNEQGAHKRYDFFSVGVYVDTVTKKRRYLSEDYYFCQRWRDMGGDVWLDTRIRAKHIGRAVYPLDMAQMKTAVYEHGELEKIRSKGNAAA